MSDTRQQICDRTSSQLKTLVPTLKSIGAVVGFDGFVDNIIAVVDKRQDRHNYEPVKTIAHMGQKIAKAAGESSNYELVVKQQKLGGNGPIMANALASFGLSVTYVGNLGVPAINPVFNEFAQKAKVISIAEPGVTDALEFEDGKLMLGKHGTLGDVNWENLVKTIGLETFTKLVSGARLIGTVNWTMLPYMTNIWQRMYETVLPALPKRETFFVDLADPEKRTPEDIHAALMLLSKFERYVDVILGLNLKEAVEILNVLKLDVPANSEAEIEAIAKAIRAKLEINCCVVHPRRGAAAATKSESGSFKGPFVQQPKISTGAGDHFNAGFCLGRTLGLGLVESLCCGVATSGYYVRTAISPSAADLSVFIAELPAPQAE